MASVFESLVVKFSVAATTAEATAVAEAATAAITEAAATTAVAETATEATTVTEATAAATVTETAAATTAIAEATTAATVSATAATTTAAARLRRVGEESGGAHLHGRDVAFVAFLEGVRLNARLRFHREHHVVDVPQHFVNDADLGVVFRVDESVESGNHAFRGARVH